VELAGIEGWWRRLLELITVATGVGRRGFGSGDQRDMEWLCSRGLYIGWSRGEKVVAVSMASGCFVITLNVAVSRRGNDQVGIGCGRGRGGDRRSYMEEVAGGQAAWGHRRGTRRNKIRHQWRLSIRALGDRKGMVRRCWDQLSALARIDRRLLLGSTVGFCWDRPSALSIGSCWDRPSAFAGIDRRLLLLDRTGRQRKIEFIWSLWNEKKEENAWELVWCGRESLGVLL
jgi:hypothetical protein